MGKSKQCTNLENMYVQIHVLDRFSTLCRTPGDIPQLVPITLVIHLHIMSLKNDFAPKKPCLKKQQNTEIPWFLVGSGMIFQAKQCSELSTWITCHQKFCRSTKNSTCGTKIGCFFMIQGS